MPILNYACMSIIFTTYIKTIHHVQHEIAHKGIDPAKRACVGIERAVLRCALAQYIHCFYHQRQGFVFQELLRHSHIPQPLIVVQQRIVIAFAFV